MSSEKPLPRYRIAMVTFMEVEAIDSSDAAAIGERMIKNAINEAGEGIINSLGHVNLTLTKGDQTWRAKVVQVVEINGAIAAGCLIAQPSSAPFRMLEEDDE